MEFCFSTIPGVKSTIAQVRKYSTTWDAWAQEVTARGHDRRSSKDGVLASPCLWADDAPSREKAFAIDSGALVIDIDGEGQETMEGLKSLTQKLEAMDLSYLLHSTFSHSVATPSFRVWVPLSRRVLKNDWLRFWNHATAALGALELRDNACKDVGRWYYMPSVARLEEPIMFYRKGKPLDVDHVWSVPAPIVTAPLVSVDPIDKKKLKAVVAKLRKKDRNDMADKVQRVIDGELLGPDEHGNRHADFLQVTGVLASYLLTVDPVEMGKIFAPTLSRYSDQTRFVPDYVAKMFRTAQEKIHAFREEEKVEEAVKRDLSIRLATDGRRETPYRAEEVALWASRMGVDPGDMARLWVLQKGNGYLTLVDGRYKGPYSREEAGAAIHLDLIPARDVGVRLEAEKNGKFVRKSATDLVIEYGTVIEGLEYSYLQDYSTYNSTSRILTIACAPKSEMKPEFHQGVADYLKVLGGGKHDLLLQWIARVPDLKYPLPVLALIGAKRAAKSGLAHALAKYWEHGRCTELEGAMAKFNADMRNCPLVFADETLPVDGKGRPRTRELRRFVQDNARDIEAKFLPRMTLKGCTRTILSANSPSVIEGEDHLTSHDVAAIAERFLLIPVGEEVAAYIDDVGHLEFRAWIECGLFARHMLYLNQTVPFPVNPPRFLIDTAGSPELANTMATGTALGSSVAEWVYRFLQNPETLYQHMGGDCKVEAVHVQGGVLYVTALVMGDHFETYCRGMSRPSARNVSRGLDSIASKGYDNVYLPLTGKRTKLRPVNPEALETWARNAQLDLDYAAGIARAEKSMNEMKKSRKVKEN